MSVETRKYKQFSLAIREISQFSIRDEAVGLIPVPEFLKTRLLAVRALTLGQSRRSIALVEHNCHLIPKAL
jgi:hypothetical protein